MYHCCNRPGSPSPSTSSPELLLRDMTLEKKNEMKLIKKVNKITWVARECGVPSRNVCILINNAHAELEEGTIFSPSPRHNPLPPRTDRRGNGVEKSILTTTAIAAVVVRPRRPLMMLLQQLVHDETGGAGREPPPHVRGGTVTAHP